MHRGFTNRGFSLVEVLCAVLILGIGLVGLTQGMTTALRSNKEAELQTAAALIAADRIEILRLGGGLMEGDEDGACEAPLSNYRWTRSIVSMPVEGLYEVTVIVGTAAGEQPIYELKTLLFDPPYYSALEESEEETDARTLRYRQQGNQ